MEPPAASGVRLDVDNVDPSSRSVATPGARRVVPHVDGWFQEYPSGVSVGAECSNSLDGNDDAADRTWWQDVRPNSAVAATFSIAGVVDVTAPTTPNAALVCTRLGNSSVAAITWMTATYLRSRLRRRQLGRQLLVRKPSSSSVKRRSSSSRRTGWFERSRVGVDDLERRLPGERDELAVPAE